MERISLEQARRVAELKGLLPGRVRGTDGIQFTRGGSARVETIGWDEFGLLLKERNLAVYESGGFLKVMKV